MWRLILILCLITTAASAFLLHIQRMERDKCEAAGGEYIVKLGECFAPGTLRKTQ